MNPELKPTLNIPNDLYIKIPTTLAELNLRQRNADVVQYVILPIDPVLRHELRETGDHVVYTFILKNMIGGDTKEIKVKSIKQGNWGRQYHHVKFGIFTDNYRKSSDKWIRLNRINRDLIAIYGNELEGKEGIQIVLDSWHNHLKDPVRNPLNDVIE